MISVCLVRISCTPSLPSGAHYSFFCFRTRLVSKILVSYISHTFLLDTTCYVSFIILVSAYAAEEPLGSHIGDMWANYCLCTFYYVSVHFPTSPFLKLESYGYHFVVYNDI